MIKAWYSNACNKTWPSPVVPSRDGQSLFPYTGGNLTICDEVDKLGWNLAFGRMVMGIHWRVDSEQGMYLGEDTAIRFLQEEINADLFADHFVEGFTFKKLDGTFITIKKTQ